MNEQVKIKGVVTADQAAIGGGKLSTFIQDGTAGINIYSGTPEEFPELKEGMEVTVTGKIAKYQGLTEIIPGSSGIEITAAKQPLPEPESFTINELINSDRGAAYEGRLVTVKAYIASKPSSQAGGGIT